MASPEPWIWYMFLTRLTNSHDVGNLQKLAHLPACLGENMQIQELQRQKWKSESQSWWCWGYNSAY